MGEKIVEDRGEEVVDLLDCFWWPFSCCSGVVGQDVEYDEIGCRWSVLFCYRFVVDL